MAEASRTTTNQGFHQLSITSEFKLFLVQYFYSRYYFPVEHASLRSHSFLKPNPYVELSIDANPARKTEIQKNTYLPKWNDTFTVLVTPTSILQFRIFDHSSFRKDSLMGEQTVHLAQILQHYNGRCENLELVMDLLYESKSEGRQLKNGELVAVLNGLKIDMTAVANVAAFPNPSRMEIHQEAQC